MHAILASKQHIQTGMSTRQVTSIPIPPLKSKNYLIPMSNPHQGRAGQIQNLVGVGYFVFVWEEFSKTISRKQFFRTVFKNCSMMFHKIKVRLGTWNVLNLFSIFLNMFKNNFIYNVLFLIILYIYIIIF